MARTILLQFVNLLFSLMPLTRGYRVRAKMLAWAGVGCSPTARVVSSARIVVREVDLGEDTFVGHQVLIAGDSTARIVIGDRVDIAPRCVILSGSHEIDMMGSRSAGIGRGGPVRIANGVWLGANTTVAPGVSIGERAVVGAGSVVVRDIPSWCIAVGNPCRVVKRWNRIEGRFETSQ
jgi:acetyltransferase-like isoleucine patch superfamily enzyme